MGGSKAWHAPQRSQQESCTGRRTPRAAGSLSRSVSGDLPRLLPSPAQSPAAPTRLAPDPAGPDNVHVVHIRRNRSHNVGQADVMLWRGGRLRRAAWPGNDQQQQQVSACLCPGSGRHGSALAPLAGNHGTCTCAAMGGRAFRRVGMPGSTSSAAAAAPRSGTQLSLVSEDQARASISQGRVPKEAGCIAFKFKQNALPAGGTGSLEAGRAAGACGETSRAAECTPPTQGSDPGGVPGMQSAPFSMLPTAPNAQNHITIA